MNALLFDAAQQRWLLFREPQKLLISRSAKESHALLKEVEAARHHSLYAVGYWSYNAFFEDGAAEGVDDDNSPPRGCFGFYRRFESIDSPQFRPLSGKAQTAFWSSSISQQRYLEQVEAVQQQIAADALHQLNYTFRLESQFEGDPLDWFCSRVGGDHRTSRPGDHLAYLEFDSWAIASLSPELFFALDRSGNITTKPMKGTLRRHIKITPELQAESDARAIEQLSHHSKNREELQIATALAFEEVAQISKAGTVRIVKQNEVEQHPTLFQMTTTISGELKGKMQEWFPVIFPPASISGSPRAPAEPLIAQLESVPRGVYTGAIGFFAPTGEARLNVAIRTALFHRNRGVVQYGVGSGIGAASIPQSEWEECWLKAAVAQPEKPFSLFTTMRLEEGELFLFDRHLQRLVASATELNVISPKEQPQLLERLRQQITQRVEQLERGVWRVRVDLFQNGEIKVEWGEIPPLAEPLRFSLAQTAINSNSLFAKHKTSERSQIEQAFESRIAPAQSNEVVLLNQRGELVESSRANLVLQIDGRHYTPPLSSGALPGTLRAELLERGELQEQKLYPCDLERATKIWLINSLRGSLEAVWADQPEQEPLEQVE